MSRGWARNYQIPGGSCTSKRLVVASAARYGDMSDGAADTHGSGPVKPRAKRARTGPLSNREREVFELLAEGLSGAQIAARLVLSPETVRTHIRNAMGKLGASTRSQAVVLALRRREIGPLHDAE